MRDRQRPLGDRVDALLQWKRSSSDSLGIRTGDLWSLAEHEEDKNLADSAPPRSETSDARDMESLLRQQYEATLQRQKEQLKQTQSMTEQVSSALATQSQQVSRQLKRATTPRIRTVSSSSSDNVNPLETVQDWVECRDPKSNRTYFFSPSLRQSTWRRPPSLQRPKKESPQRQSPEQRQSSPPPLDTVSVSSAGSSMFSQRAASAGALPRSQPPSRQPSPSPRGALTRGSDWVEALDHKSQRRYYYNR